MRFLLRRRANETSLGLASLGFGSPRGETVPRRRPTLKPASTTALGRAALATVAALALAVGGLQAARFAFRLPAPSGPFRVATTMMGFERPLEPGEASPGRFTVQVWYPGLQSADRAPYVAGSSGVERWLYERLVRTNAARDVGVAASPRRFPILVYLAGWGGVRTDNTALLEDLASHGFVVAAIGDVARDSPPLQRLAAPLDFGSQAAFQATRRLAAEKLEYTARRVSAVLDRLSELDARDPQGRFTKRLDISRAGVLGYSFGGAVAFAAARRDPRFKAVMNLDGWLFNASSGYRGGLPYFVVSGDSPVPGPDYVTDPDPDVRYASQLTVVDDEQQREVLRHGGYELTVNGADHLSFSDVPLCALRHRFGNGHFDPQRVASAVHAYAVAFFERTLEDNASPLLVPGEKEHPAMTLASWPLGAPR